ncbi:NAD(P)/FAD-dependent oxidoreductase [Gammaproteobacteria bacterium]|nr:NAD(P)/FAD-dependent oxidoreductase [Gammaproteobacteria bacterium]
MSKTKEVDIIIIGAGPVGLFTVFEAGLLGLKCILIDNLDKVGGQCAELYPEKPIYDIPGVPMQTAEEHVRALLEQIKPFDYSTFLNQRVESISENSSTEDEVSSWTVTTSEKNQFTAKNIFIAAGAGSFEPRRPPNIEDPDRFIGKGVSYAVRDKSLYEDKDVLIFGGGDSALDWTVDLSGVAKSVTLIHRRDEFRGAPNTESQMRKLIKQGVVNLKTPYVIESLIGDGVISGVSIKNFETKELENLSCDEIIFLFGLNKKLGPIVDWNLDLEGKKITVDTEKFETNIDGIFAVGDINNYPGKLDLILSGFHETTLAVQHAYKRCFPGERVPFGYTTSNTKLQKKLGVIK